MTDLRAYAREAASCPGVRALSVAQPSRHRLDSVVRLGDLQKNAALRSLPTLSSRQREHRHLPPACFAMLDLLWRGCQAFSRISPSTIAEALTKLQRNLSMILLYDEEGLHGTSDTLHSEVRRHPLMDDGPGRFSSTVYSASESLDQPCHQRTIHVRDEQPQSVPRARLSWRLTMLNDPSPSMMPAR